MVVDAIDIHSVDLLLNIDLSSQLVLHIKDGSISLDSISKAEGAFLGTDLELLATIADHLTSKVFHSLHRLLYHSSFLGHIPSIVSEAREDVSSIFASSYSKCLIDANLIEILAMFPIMNVAAKGLLQVVSNIGYSIGSNIYKATLGQRQSDAEQYLGYLERHLSGEDWTCQRLQGQTRYLLESQLSIPISMYIDECLLMDNNGLQLPAHLAVLEDQSLCFLFEEAPALTLFRLEPADLKAIDSPSFDKHQITSEFITVQVTLRKKRAKVSPVVHLAQSPFVEFEVPSRHVREVAKLAQALASSK